MTTRSDAETVRWIYENRGAAVAARWQRLPFVDLTDVPECMLPWPGDDLVIGEDAMPLPWDAFVLNKGSEHTMLLTRDLPGDFIDNVTEYKKGLAMPGLSTPSAFLANPRTGHPRTLISAFGRNPAGHPRHRALMDADLQPHREWVEQLTNLLYGYALCAIAYMVQTPQYATEVINAIPRVKAKTAKLKPWLRDDLPRIILMDPTTAARKYGMPPPQSLENPRRAPVPHNRRGHWRTLADTRRIWVRPAWIGPETWESQGQIYRVLASSVL